MTNEVSGSIERISTLAGQLQEEAAALAGRQTTATGGQFVAVERDFVWTPVPSEADLQETHVNAYKGLGNIAVSKPSKDVRDTLLIASDLGWPLKGHFIPKVTDELLRSLPVPLNRFYLDNKANGNIKDTAKGGYWVVVDNSIRANYGEVIKNDYLGPILARGRAERQINTKGYEDIPQTARVAVSHDEGRRFVLPNFARPLRINEKWARFLFAEEASILGNIFYPHFGEANTWEWYWNVFEDDGRLIGGDSDSRGLSNVNCNWADDHDDCGSLRPLGVFPPK